MRWLCLVVFVLTCFGCNPKAQTTSIADDWTSVSRQPGESGLTFIFAQDGTYAVLAGNQLASGFRSGSYRQDGDEVSMQPQVRGVATGQPTTFKIVWTTLEDIQLSNEIGSYQLKRSGSARRTAPVDPPGGHATPAAADQAHQTTCVSNLRQITTALLVYAEDFDQTLPTVAAWNTKLFPYVKNARLYTCPTLALVNIKGGYALDSRTSELSIRKVATPRTTTLFFESTTLGFGVSDPLTSLLPKPRHDGRINMTFLDGHVGVKP